MKKTRRTFLKNTGKLTLATSFTYWWMSCESNKTETTGPFLQVSKLFSDNMVLQRNQPIPIWGWADDDATIILFFNKKKYTAKVQDGAWKFSLPALPAGGTHQIKIQNGTDEITISNIVMGDVFLFSGQSNMEWPMGRVDGGEDEIAQANDTQIRHFKVPISFSTSLERDIKGGSWKITTPKNVVHFSAAAYFFAQNIRVHHDVPIGLINATKGSTSIKMWLSQGIFGVPSLDDLIEKGIKNRLPHLEKRFGNIPITEQKTKGWSSPKLDDEKWATVQLPLSWGDANFMEVIGVIWFRKTFFLKKIPSSKVKISIGQIDDADATFLNGKKIGEGKQIYNPARQYDVEPSFFQKGKNVLAIRVENYGDFGGVFGDANGLFFQIKNKKESLAGTWKVKLEKFQYNKNRLYENDAIPCVLYNSIIHPLQHFPFKAILWYQGEGNVSKHVNELFEYRFLFKKLIDSWRNHFGNQELPFVFAQISNAMATCKTPKDSHWARLRESQSSILKNTPHTAQVINIDSGKHKNSMHPQNKPELGKRFALAIRKLVYQEDVDASGPIFQKMEKRGNQLHLHFSVIENRLLLKFGSQVNELAIASSDRNFRWAKSKIENNKIIVWHEKIDDPIAVRYAWCDNPLRVNLCDFMGLPAAPFRTDDWEWKK